MSQPPFDQAIGYQSFEPPAPPKRPASVTTLGIIGIILGALSVLCSPLALLPYFMQFGPPQPAVEVVKNDSALFGYMVGSIALGWVVGVVLLVCSIGVMMLKEWARKGLLAYAWIAIVMGVIGLVVMFAWYIPRVAAAPGIDQATLMGQRIGAPIGAVIGMIYPIFVLVFMNKAHVRAAFDQRDANLY